MSTLLELAMELIRHESVSPVDAGCQALIAGRLEALGFHIEHMPFADVSNLYARLGTEAPVLCFAGHTDVVPAGKLDQWQSHPFQPEIRDGKLYGRGAADMKGSLAAMIVAAEQFLKKHPGFKGSLAFLITSDEEADAINGTRRVMEALSNRDEKLDYCLVGEPSSADTLGDVVRNGRRGSLNATLTVHGIQGHVAYPDKALNPVHAFLPALAELSSTVWDEGNEYFPATSFQISNIHAGTGVTNVIPGDLRVQFNFRFSSENTASELKTRTEAIFNRHYQKYSLDWQLSGNPFLTRKGAFTAAVADSIRQITGTETSLSTGGGTSDGRFIAPYGVDVVELGPCNATIHKLDECVSVTELEQLAQVYEDLMRRVLA